MTLSAHIGEQAARVNRNPSDGQKKAGNYQKGHVRLHGLSIAIENPRGSYRSGIGENGRPWQSRLPHHYGYIKRTEGSDGDHVDVFIGPHPKSGAVYVVDQRDLRTGDHDEHKVMMGFASEKQAREAYKKAFSDGRGGQRIGSIEGMTMEGFKDWLKSKRRASGGKVQSDIPAFNDDEPSSTVPSFDESKQFGRDGRPVVPIYTSDEPADHGLSERRKLSQVQKALSPITSYWPTYQRMNREAREQFSHGVGQITTPGNGAWETTKGLGNAGMGALGYLGSPINAAYRSIAGQPVEDVTGIPREYTEFAGQLATPGLGVTRLPRAPGAVTETAPRIVPRGPDFERSKELGDEFNIRYSRGQSEGDLDRIRYEDMAARGAYGKEAQDRAAKFFEDQYRDVSAAGREVGEGFAGPHSPLDSPHEAAVTLSGEMRDRLQQAHNIVNRVVNQSQAEANAQRGMLADQGQTINDVVRGAAPPVGSAREMGETVGEGVRGAAAANRAERTARYNEVRDLPGEFRVDAIQGMGTRVRNEIGTGDNPIIIDDQLTPSASRAIQALDEMSIPRIQNRASPHAEPDPSEIVAISLRGMDQMRKKLIAYYQAARNNPTDARAVQGIIHGFDAQIERALTEGLFSGDPRALEALREARASHARYRQTFGPQGAGDDVGAAMRRIVERNATPEEIANMIVGSGKLGNSGTSVRLADRLEQVLGGPGSEGWSAIRQAMWQKASQVRTAAGEIDPAKSAAAILDFTNSTLARRMFSPEELSAMRSHARGIRDLERIIAESPATRNAEAAQRMYGEVAGGAGIGGNPQAVFRKIVDGTATPEEISAAVFNVTGGSNPGNVARMIRAVERVVGRDSESMAAIRQGVWQRTTMNAEGRSGMGMQRVVNNISELLHGKGRTVAEALYTPEQIALMDRYAEALRRTIIPKFARTNSDTAPALVHTLRKYAAAVASAIGVGTHGGISGGLEGWAVGKLIDKGAEKLSAHRETKKISQSLDNIMPQDRARRARVPAVWRANPYSAPGRAPNATPLLQGAIPSRADQEQRNP